MRGVCTGLSQATLTSTEPGATMNRTTVRLVASLLAAGITLSELIGIELLAERAEFAGAPALELPRTTVTPTRAQLPDLGTWTESVDASSAVDMQAASRARN